MKMERAIALFLDYCRSKELRPKTMHSYEQALRLFMIWVQEKEGIEEVEQVQEMTVRSYILSLQSRGKYAVTTNPAADSINHPTKRTDYLEKITNTTINNYLRNMNVFFKWLEEIEYLPKSPMRRVRLLPDKRKAREYLNDEEVKALINALDKSIYAEYRDRLVAMLMLDAGTRLGETLSIEMDEIDLVERSIRLPAEKTKGRRTRRVFFSMKLAVELRRWVYYKDVRCDSQFLFPVQRTGYRLKVSNYEANFRKYLQRCGIEKKISPHTFRNNFAKRCLMAGMDIYTLSRILGHSSVKVTERAYLDITDADLKEKYAKFSPIEQIYNK